MTDRLLALRIFVRTAHSGSFSRAGRELGLSQPSASRILAQLEKEVGAALLVRTTRAVTLTEAGADYLARVEPLLWALDEADHAARGAGELRGVLRVALSHSFGVREVIPRLPKFTERHPALRIDLGINDARRDLVADGVDVALRLGLLPDSSSVARKLGQAPRLLAASPAYLERRGRPRNPGDLAAHAVIVGPGGSGPSAWTFAKDGRRTSVRVEGRLTTAANEGAVAGAVAGLGITLTSLWGCRAELERGDLAQVMEDWTMEPVELHALFPAGRAASPAARAFVDYLAPLL
ncbi:MAG: LysR family transcriptional regulator [Roseiarcus sp.]|jgi:DNA-binding transcriptional LysR family regulator